MRIGVFELDCVFQPLFVLAQVRSVQKSDYYREKKTRLQQATTHAVNLEKAADPARIKRNRSLIRPLKDLFLELLPQYNAAIFDNQEQNMSYNENTLDLYSKIASAVKDALGTADDVNETGNTEDDDEIMEFAPSK